METINSSIPLNYKTIKVTQGRINKGLLSIPVSLIDLFPKKRGTIYLVNEDGILDDKSFSPYSSSTHECRIGGLKEFYNKYSIKSGNELVIHKIDAGIYKLLPESVFFNQITKSINKLEQSEDSDSINDALSKVAKLANITPEKMIENEFVKLSNNPIIPEREIRNNGINTKRKGVSFFFRNILKTIYNGKCQITNFSFIQKNGEPYFEIHHIDPNRGNHLKNLLVVSPNIHAQFTHMDVELGYEDNNPSKWLRIVKFNNEIFNVFQKIDLLEKSFSKEIHSI